MITELDQRLFDRAARGDTPVLDRVLPPLTHSADHGLLWLGLVGLLAVTGHRRAALRGLTSMAVASATANVPAKLSIRRPRPHLGGVPLPRRLVHQPTTTSFPSGHSASAAAFAAGVALESPWVGLPVATLACGVAYGRVHTGVHYPGDVVAKKTGDPAAEEILPERLCAARAERDPAEDERPVVRHQGVVLRFV